MFVSVLQLWLPVLLSAVFCWIASALIHMVIKYHNADYKKLNNETAPHRDCTTCRIVMT